MRRGVPGAWRVAVGDLDLRARERHALALVDRERPGELERELRARRRAAEGPGEEAHGRDDDFSAMTRPC